MTAEEQSDLDDTHLSGDLEAEERMDFHRDASPCDHEELRREPDHVRRLAFVGIMDYGFTVLELYNCTCGSTISIPGIGPSQKGDDQ